MSISILSKSNGPKLSCGVEYLSKIICDKTHINSINRLVIESFNDLTYLNGYFGDFDRITYKVETENNNDTSKIKVEVEEYLNSIEMQIDDYIKGTCSYKDKEKDSRQFKIGKILSKNNNKLVQQFEKDVIRVGSKNNVNCITISRNPYDIALQSTGRGWISCMQLGYYGNTSVSLSVARNSLIAYFHKEDENDLHKPSGRVLLKPYIFIEDNKKKIVYFNTSKIYGSVNKSIKDYLDQICNEINTSLDITSIVVDSTIDKLVYNDGEVQNKTVIIQKENMYEYLITNYESLGNEFYKNIDNLKLSDNDKINLYLKNIEVYGDMLIPEKYIHKNPDLLLSNNRLNLRNNFGSKCFEIDESIFSMVDDMIEKIKIVQTPKNLYYVLNMILFSAKYGETESRTKFIKDVLNKKKSIKNQLRFIYDNTTDENIKKLLIKFDIQNYTKSKSFDFYKMDFNEVSNIVSNFKISIKSMLKDIIPYDNKKSFHYQGGKLFYNDLKSNIIIDRLKSLSQEELNETLKDKSIMKTIIKNGYSRLIKLMDIDNCDDVDFYKKIYNFETFNIENYKENILIDKIFKTAQKTNFGKKYIISRLKDYNRYWIHHSNDGRIKIYVGEYVGTFR